MAGVNVRKTHTAVERAESILREIREEDIRMVVDVRVSRGKGESGDSGAGSSGGVRVDGRK